MSSRGRRRAGTAGAITFDGFQRRFFHARIGRQPKIIIRAGHNDFSAFDLDDRPYVLFVGRLDPGVPFGGFQESGLGREGGRHGLEAYLDLPGTGTPDV